MILFFCQCGQRIVAKAELAGKETQCPVCGHMIQVPLSEPVLSESEMRAGQYVSFDEENLAPANSGDEEMLKRNGLTWHDHDDKSP